MKDVWSSSDGATWSLITSTAGWSGRRQHSVYDNKLYLMGGFDVPRLLNDVWSSTDGETWTQLNTPGWNPRRQHTSVVANDKIYVMGGYSAVYTSKYNNVWSMEWTENLLSAYSKSVDETAWYGTHAAFLGYVVIKMLQ